MRLILLTLLRVPVILAVLALVVIAGPWRADRIGDRLQVALPLLAWACTATKAEAGEYFLRYAAMFATAHATKAALGDAELNQRPSGGLEGFPSAHTSTAVLGASRLVHDCVKAHPLGQAVIVLAAGFVGGSRIEIGKHDIWQVLAGAVLGYTADRALRRPTPARARVAAGLRWMGRWLARLAAGTLVRLQRLAAIVRGLAAGAPWRRLGERS